MTLHSNTYKQYFDANHELVKIGNLVEVKFTSGKYGQTTIKQGVLTKIDQYSGVTLDDELYIAGVFEYDFESKKLIGFKEHVDYEHGHTRYLKKIKKDDLRDFYKIKKQLFTYTIRLIDFTEGKNRDKRHSNNFPILLKIEDDRVNARKKFDDYLEENFPQAVKININDKKTEKYYKERANDGLPKLLTLEVIITPRGKNSTIEKYGL